MFVFHESYLGLYNISSLKSDTTATTTRTTTTITNVDQYVPSFVSCHNSVFSLWKFILSKNEHFYKSLRLCIKFDNRQNKTYLINTLYSLTHVRSSTIICFDLITLVDLIVEGNSSPFSAYVSVQLMFKGGSSTRQRKKIILTNLYEVSYMFDKLFLIKQGLWDFFF